MFDRAERMFPHGHFGRRKPQRGDGFMDLATRGVKWAMNNKQAIAKAASTVMSLAKHLPHKQQQQVTGMLSRAQMPLQKAQALAHSVQHRRNHPVVRDLSNYFNR